MKPAYQDLYRRDLQRIAAWPPKFRGEGPFLPTGRRRTVRGRSVWWAAATVGLLSAVLLPWRAGLGDPGTARHDAPAAARMPHAADPAAASSVGGR